MNLVFEYHCLLKQLLDIRASNFGGESSAEEDILAQMDIIWSKMSAIEKGQVDALICLESGTR